MTQPPCQTHLGVRGGLSASSCCREYTRAALCRGGGGGGASRVPSRCGSPCACVCAAAVLAWCARSAAATSNGPSGWRAGGHGGGDSSASASPGGPTARCGQRDVDADAHGGAGGRCKNALLNAAASFQSGSAGIAAAGAPQGALSSSSATGSYRKDACARVSARCLHGGRRASTLPHADVSTPSGLTLDSAASSYGTYLAWIVRRTAIRARAQCRGHGRGRRRARVGHAGGAGGTCAGACAAPLAAQLPPRAAAPRRPGLPAVWPGAQRGGACHARGCVQAEEQATLRSWQHSPCEPRATARRAAARGAAARLCCESGARRRARAMSRGRLVGGRGAATDNSRARSRTPAPPAPGAARCAWAAAGAASPPRAGGQPAGAGAPRPRPAPQRRTPPPDPPSFSFLSRPLQLPGLANAKTEPWVVRLGALEVAIQEVPFGACGAQRFPCALSSRRALTCTRRSAQPPARRRRRSPKPAATA